MRTPLYDAGAAKRPINLTLNGDLVARARVEGLNLSALAEEAVAAALARRAREKLAAEIAQACRVHEQYLAEYGSLGEALRNGSDAAEYQSMLAGYRASPGPRFSRTVSADRPAP